VTGHNETVTSVAVLDDYQRRASEFADWRSLGDGIDVDFISEPIPRERLAERLAGYEALVLMRERTRFDEAVLAQLPQLRLVVTTGMRNASLDVDYLQRRGVRGGVQWLDARRCVTVEWGPLGPAVQWQESKLKLQALLPAQPPTTLVITGFIASDPRGVQTTLGRNGSDFSASIFGAPDSRGQWRRNQRSPVAG